MRKKHFILLATALCINVLTLSAFQQSVSLCVIEASIPESERSPLGTIGFTIVNSGKTETTLVEPTILFRVDEVMYSGSFTKQRRITIQPKQSYKGQINCKELVYHQHSTTKRMDYTAFLNILKKGKFVETCVSYTDMSVLKRHKANENFLVFSKPIRIR